MKPEEFYRDVDPNWCQGDIVRQVPHIHLKLPLKALRRESNKFGDRLAPYEYQFGSNDENVVAPPGGFKFQQGEPVEAFCQLALGMILSHGCEMDKDTKHRQVALIRPLDAIPTLQDRQIIRENRNFSYCYLPAYSDTIAESYVDFRRITTIQPGYLRNSDRILSLTDAAVKYLNIQFVRYLTRLDLNPNALDKLQ